MMQPRTSRQDHAIVLGASMGGLAAAQALSHHFRRVTIIERDRLPGQPAARAGVPQGRHLHALLPGGLRALESLVPGFGDGLRAAGAVQIGVPDEFRWLNPSGWIERFPTQHRLLSASRNLIEWYTRQRLLENPGITIADGLSVSDLLATPSGDGVRGVRVRPIDAVGQKGDDAANAVIAADLVVDTTGRRSQAPEWLERLGFGRPAETKIDAGLSYATRIYEPSGRAHDWKALFLQSSPPDTTRMGILFPIEGNRWMVTLQGAGGDHPPTDEQGFLDFARSLRGPEIFEAIRDAKALTPAVAFANTANRRRHYEKMRRWPEGFIAMGDSACAFNPIYGQGMSVAAQTAVALDERLTRHVRRHRTLDGFARSMQRQVARSGKAAWMIATGDDLRLPTTTSTAGAGANAITRLQHRYLDRVLAAATHDEVVLAAVMNAFFLLSPPESLFRPSIVSRAMRRRQGLHTAPTPPLAVTPTR